MAEHPREVPLVHHIPATLPESQMNWLEQMDINVHDFIYIDHFLKAAFEEWQHAASTYHEELRFWFVTNVRGDMIQSDCADSSEGPIKCSDTITTSSEWMSIAVLEPLRVLHDSKDWLISTIPLRTRQEQETYAYLGCVYSQEAPDLGWMPTALKMVGQHFTACFYKQLENMFVKDLLGIQVQSRKETQRRTFLFQVIQRLQDKIDVDAVINEVLDSLAGVYPNAKLEIFMSQDHQSKNARVKPLSLQDDEEQLCVRAFMEGIMLRNDYVGDDGQAYLELAVPLSGKQGVYGVFHLYIPRDQFEEVDMQLINMLADTAGTSFENAKLYEQSNLLIHELRLINELTQQLSQSLQLKEVFKFATEELLHIFDAEHCCISQLDKDKEFFEMVSCNIPELAKEVFPRDYGFNGLVYATKEPIILSDYREYGRVYSKLMEFSGARSLIGAPLIVRGEVIGTILLVHSQPYFFSYDNYKLLQLLSIHIGLAIANASLHAEVRRMANRDMLTGLFARHYLDDVVQELQSRDANGSLIVVDIDHFKQINDRYGHQIGDKILKQVCVIIRSAIRKIDIPARWGGEELAVYLPGLDIMKSRDIAEDIRVRVEAETSPSVTVSCGISEWNRRDDKISVESLFYRADMALYQSKNNGRNQTRIGEHHLNT
ncbi:diguanylate cyclase (GGDEF)-like protein [Paenibacillus shirakamiensis]|uniref:Diguanylate cyclase (GGDEF)-like protein n=1 Tax=Paenibacillus shirakamiensis TaxID=1265935 RepID=A0ABS4JDY7_9BACL|nr:diguanylate cyclase [Paenibacillus shirakamiensis]MBP1999321.1 diguanylate cyclase (GGDEF)-like protein [Paenibacillus shirakamiensis]